MHLVELTAAGNEASDLLRVHDEDVLKALGARSAYWTVLDEGPVEECLALLVESADGQWSARHVPAQAGAQTGRTEDAEALAWDDGWVYVLGSHFGSKKGPLRPKRAFVARFRESLTPSLEIVKHQFALHRTVNDALVGLVAAPPAGVQESFIGATVQRGQANGKKWVGQLAHGDHPINVEGAAFTPAGTLLVGLRWPVTADGAPILVELASWPGAAERSMHSPSGTAVTDARAVVKARQGSAAQRYCWGEPPSVVAAYALAGVGQGPLGVRALSARLDGGFDVIVGSIDALDKGSVLLDNHPEARDATCRHYRFSLPPSRGFGSFRRSRALAQVGLIAERSTPPAANISVKADLVADLAPLHHVEGVSQWHGSPLYVTDEDHRIALYTAPLL